jgi:hypothetical protein
MSTACPPPLTSTTQPFQSSPTANQNCIRIHAATDGWGEICFHAFLDPTLCDSVTDKKTPDRANGSEVSRVGTVTLTTLLFPAT